MYRSAVSRPLRKIITISCVLTIAAASSIAAAHLMVAQRGTLNFEGDGVYMVLSLPVSAFSNVDEDGDGKLSATEFASHRPEIISAVNNGVQLRDKKGPQPLEGMMLTPVTPHNNPEAPSDQLVVMGRFALADVTNELHFKVTLFGDQPDQQKMVISATRKATKDKQQFELNLTKPAHRLFPSIQ